MIWHYEAISHDAIPKIIGPHFCRHFICHSQCIKRSKRTNKVQFQFNSTPQWASNVYDAQHTAPQLQQTPFVCYIEEDEDSNMMCTMLKAKKVAHTVWNHVVECSSVLY